MKIKKYFEFLLCASCVLAGARAFASESKSPFELFETYNSATITLPDDCDGDLWADSKYVFAYGAKLRFTGIELRYFNSCGKTMGEELYKIDSWNSYYDVFEKSRYSLCCELKKFEKNLDAKFALGSLGVSSKMKSPTISTTISPFVSALSDAAALSPSLPTKNSAKKDDALFTRATFHFIENASNETIRFLPVHAEFFCVKNELDGDRTPWLCALRGGFLYKNFFKITTGFWFERYYVSDEGSADIYWLEEIPVWNSSLYNSFMNETTISIPYFKNKIIFGVTENAQSLGRYWLRDEMLFKAGSFSVAAAAFISDNVFLHQEIPIATTGNSKKYTLWQTKLIPELTLFMSKGATIKFGAGGYLEEKIQNYGKTRGGVSTQYDSLDAKFSTGAKYSSKSDSAKITFTVSNIEIHQHLKEGEEKHLPKLSAATSYSHKFKNKRRIYTSASASVQLAHDESENEYAQSFKICYYPALRFVKSFALGMSASQKDSGSKISPYAKAVFLFKLKKVKINADIAVNANFKFSE